MCFLNRVLMLFAVLCSSHSFILSFFLRDRNLPRQILRRCGPQRFHRAAQIRRNQEVCSNDDVKSLMEGLVARIDGLEQKLQSVLDAKYVDDKSRIIGELASIYKERVIEYALFQDDYEFTYCHLIQGRNTSFEVEFLNEFNARRPHLKASLVTKVNAFFTTHDAFITHRPTNSNSDAVRAIALARAFEFKEDDPDKQFAEELCEVLHERVTHKLLPVKDKLHHKFSQADIMHGSTGELNWYGDDKEYFPDEL